MVNIFNLASLQKTYQSYGDILENKKSFDLTRNEQEIYELIQQQDKARLLKFG